MWSLALVACTDPYSYVWNVWGAITYVRGSHDIYERVSISYEDCRSDVGPYTYHVYRHIDTPFEYT